MEHEIIKYMREIGINIRERKKICDMFEKEHQEQIKMLEGAIRGWKKKVAELEGLKDD